MNKNKKNIKQYKQIQINKAKDSVYSGLYSGISCVATILVTIITNINILFKGNASISPISSAILIVMISIGILLVKRKTKKIKDLEKENKFLSHFLPQWTIEMGYLSPIVFCLPLLQNCINPIGMVILIDATIVYITWDIYKQYIIKKGEKV